MVTKTHTTDVAKLLRIIVRLRFSAVREHAKFLHDAFAPTLDDLGQQFQNASGEIAEMLSDEAAAINDLIDQTVPLILLRAYATYEAFVFRFIGMVTNNPNLKIKPDWIKAIKCLDKANIPWIYIQGANQVETMRLLINAYKHHDGKIYNEELASRLGNVKGERIEWGNIEYKEYISCCEKVLYGLIAKIP